MKIRFKKLNVNAKAPTQAKASDAGYDLYALENVRIQPFERKIIHTGIAVEIPEGYYGRVAPRSGLAAKAGIDVLAGVIDSGYRDGIGVILINLNMADIVSKIARQGNSAMTDIFGVVGTFEVKAGDRIAQLIIEKCHDVMWWEVDELSSSDRNTGGFGSSGK